MHVPQICALKKGCVGTQDGDQNDVPHVEAFHKQIIHTSPFPIFNCGKGFQLHD